jgi:putative cardiolipin synthase
MMNAGTLLAATRMAARVLEPRSRVDVVLAVVCRICIVVLVFWMAGCASLPDGVARPVSHAATDVDGTRLAAIAAASTPESARGLSGLRLLPAGDQSFEARIALVRRAEQSLDLQYYEIAPDASGLQLMRALRDAAARGVRVRLLVDDLYAAGEDELLAGLAAQPNVEVRLFNPLPSRRGSFNGRIVRSLHEASRINRRMHNKLFVADGSFAIAGGRNVADEYFGRSGPANFIDMDILATGPVVDDLARVFDAFWNSEHAYPVQSLARRMDAPAARRAFDARVAALPEGHAASAGLDALGQSSLETQLALGQVDRHFALVRVLADAPAKIDAPRGSGADGQVMDGALALLQDADAEVMLASPYFVPGERGLATMRAAVDRDVQVHVMTNSLATTDEPLVHFGYARYRSALLKMGVSLHELMPDAEPDVEAAGQAHGSLGRLHAKLAIVDQRWLFIGSMNMDRRSARTNTEIALVIDSPALAGEAADLLRRERLPASYRLRLAADGRRIEWMAGGAEAGTVLRSEPGGAGGHFGMRLMSMVVHEDML